LEYMAILEKEKAGSFGEWKASEKY
jgi:hypothetical protein